MTDIVGEDGKLNIGIDPLSFALGAIAGAVCFGGHEPRKGKRRVRVRRSKKRRQNPLIAEKKRRLFT